MKEFFQNSKRTRPRIELPEKGGRKMSKPIAKAKFYAMTAEAAVKTLQSDAGRGPVSYTHLTLPTKLEV